MNELELANPNSQRWNWKDGSFSVGSDSIRLDLLYNCQNKNGMSHFRIGTDHCDLPKIGEEIFQ